MLLRNSFTYSVTYKNFILVLYGECSIKNDLFHSSTELSRGHGLKCYKLYANVNQTDLFCKEIFLGSNLYER